MGSLRNPIGPLPSSIYWRRRAVAAALFALVVLLAVWAVSSFGGGGGDGGKSDSKAGGAGKPTPSTITPGPSGSGPAISQQPGGRDESGDAGDTGGADGANGSNGSNGSGSGSSSGSGTGSGQGGGGGAGGQDGGAAGGAPAGERVPAGSSLPDCAQGALKLTLRSVKVAYEPDEKPRFQLVASNTSGTTCKQDFGPRAAVITVVDATDGKNDTVWSTKDCPSRAGLEPGSLLLKVPAHASITHTVDWDRKRTAPQCATPPPGTVPPGNYLVEAEVGGAKVLPAPFRLEKE